MNVMFQPIQAKSLDSTIDSSIKTYYEAQQHLAVFNYCYNLYLHHDGHQSRLLQNMPQILSNYGYSIYQTGESIVFTLNISRHPCVKALKILYAKINANENLRYKQWFIRGSTLLKVLDPQYPEKKNATSDKDIDISVFPASHKDLIIHHFKHNKNVKELYTLQAPKTGYYFECHRFENELSSTNKAWEASRILYDESDFTLCLSAQFDPTTESLSIYDISGRGLLDISRKQLVIAHPDKNLTALQILRSFKYMLCGIHPSKECYDTINQWKASAEEISETKHDHLRIYFDRLCSKPDHRDKITQLLNHHFPWLAEELFEKNGESISIKKINIAEVTSDERSLDANSTSNNSSVSPEKIESDTESEHSKHETSSNQPPPRTYVKVLKKNNPDEEINIKNKILPSKTEKNKTTIVVIENKKYEKPSVPTSDLATTPSNAGDTDITKYVEENFYGLRREPEKNNEKTKKIKNKNKKNNQKKSCMDLGDIPEPPPPCAPTRLELEILKHAIDNILAGVNRVIKKKEYRREDLDFISSAALDIIFINKTLSEEYRDVLSKFYDQLNEYPEEAYLVLTKNITDYLKENFSIKTASNNSVSLKRHFEASDSKRLSRYINNQRQTFEVIRGNLFLGIPTPTICLFFIRAYFPSLKSMFHIAAIIFSLSELNKLNKNFNKAVNQQQALFLIHKEKSDNRLPFILEMLTKMIAPFIDIQKNTLPIITQTVLLTFLFFILCILTSTMISSNQNQPFSVLITLCILVNVYQLVMTLPETIQYAVEQTATTKLNDYVGALFHHEKPLQAAPQVKHSILSKNKPKN